MLWRRYTAADRVTLTEKAKEISNHYKSTTSVEKPALSAAGGYLEESMEKITTSKENHSKGERQSASPSPLITRFQGR